VNERAQVIERDGKPEWAVIPYAEYQRLQALAEDAEDVRAFDQAVAALGDGEETVPGEVVRRLVTGENPLRVWREHRGLTQVELAKRAGVGQPYVALLEAGERKGSVARLRALARVLGLDMDDLVPHQKDPQDESPGV
jgi:DNA-binding XRE family transcriptional regulator